MNKLSIEDRYLNNYIISLAEDLAKFKGGLEIIELSTNYDGLSDFQKKQIELARCNLSTASNALHSFFRQYEDNENKQEK